MTDQAADESSAFDVLALTSSRTAVPIPAGCKRGRITTPKTGERKLTLTDKRTGLEQTTPATRSWWETTAAPHFTADPSGWIMNAIPVPGAAA